MIIGIGLSRTGSTSLHHILLQLGFKSKHFIRDLLQDPTAALNTVKSLADKLTNDQSVQDTIKQLKKGKGVDKLLKGLFGSQGG